MKRPAIPVILTLLLTLACDPEPQFIPDSPQVFDTEHTGMFILCEGLYNQNNSTLAWHDFSTGHTDSWQSGNGLSFDCFEKANGRRLGDTANGMVMHGSRLYIAVCESGTVEVVDAATCRSLSQIKLEGAQPRALAAHGPNVYVCCYDGTVARIDTASMAVTGRVQAGRNPDAICCAGGKLYVSNSGGLDYGDPDSTVSVIGLEPFAELKRIAVRTNPWKLGSDGKSVFVISRGRFDYTKMDYDCRLHKIDTGTDSVTRTFDIAAMNFDIAGSKAWLYEYGSGDIMVMDTETGIITDCSFIKDGTRVECPYGIMADAATGRIYVLDAADYVTPGSVLCFNSSGHLEYELSGIGINPNTILFYDSQVIADREKRDDTGSHITKVFQYRPAPGQFVNVLPKYEDGDGDSIMAAKCLACLNGSGMITLGGFGGYITAGFGKAVMNAAGNDFKIEGNALKGSAEPGVVWVSADANANRLPDDDWYQIAGSEYAGSIMNCEITYLKSAKDIPWYTADGQSGNITRNSYHKQEYWPLWYDCDSICYTATLLPDNYAFTGGTWVLSAFAWGYADNLPNSSDGCCFDISWAVREDGTPAALDSINFIKIQSGVIGCNATTGEMSTEISSISNLHP